MQQARANQELHWDAGTAQVDFGAADFDVNGIWYPSLNEIFDSIFPI